MPLGTDDLVAIQQLYARYNTAIDTGDGQTFAHCFVPDGTFDPGNGVQEGREAIAAFAENTHKAMPLMRHNATNVVADGDGQKATGSAFLIGYLAGPDHKVIVTGRYHDTLVKTDEGWQFTERNFRPDA